jgi:thymidylate synthase
MGREVWNFEAADVNEYYVDVCKALIEEGTETSPRGKRTKELHPTTVIIFDPRQRIVTSHGRMVNLPFALAEVIQIITGQNDAQALKYYNSKIIDIQGDTPDATEFNAAYGERLRHYDAGSRVDVPYPGVDQLKHVIETLRRDPDSRQASIVLSHPYWDSYEARTKDRACNVYAHAMIRNGRLDWMQVIRSNDAIWGIPYNVIQWSHVQEWVAASLDVQLGHMFIVQDSFHVYEEMYEECRAVKPFDMYHYLDMVPLRMEASEEISTEIFTAERAIRMGMAYDRNALKYLENIVGPYWRAVIQSLHAYTAFKRKFDDLALEILPVYAELRAPMLRNFCHWRWNKNKNCADLVQKAYLDILAYGVPHEEAKKWLGIK